MCIVNEVFLVVKFGIVINFFINFFLYCLSVWKFCKELFKVFGFWCGDREELFLSFMVFIMLFIVKFKMLFKV